MDRSTTESKVCKRLSHNSSRRRLGVCPICVGSEGWTGPRLSKVEGRSCYRLPMRKWLMGWLRKCLEESDICWDSPGRGSKFGVCVCEDAHDARSSGCSLLSSQMILTPLLGCVVGVQLDGNATDPPSESSKSLDSTPSEPNRSRLTKCIWNISFTKASVLLGGQKKDDMHLTTMHTTISLYVVHSTSPANLDTNSRS
jgi:hypothetical protein